MVGVEERVVPEVEEVQGEVVSKFEGEQRARRLRVSKYRKKLGYTSLEAYIRVKSLSLSPVVVPSFLPSRTRTL